MMMYKQGKRQKPNRKLLIAVLLLLISVVLYSLLIYNWWVEGNTFDYKRKIEDTAAEYKVTKPIER